MARVIIDGIEYAPKVDMSKPDDSAINKALAELVSLYYFEDWHKASSRVWDAINHINPELANLVSDDPRKAYGLFREED